MPTIHEFMYMVFAWRVIAGSGLDGQILDTHKFATTKNYNTLKITVAGHGSHEV